MQCSQQRWLGLFYRTWKASCSYFSYANAILYNPKIYADRTLRIWPRAWKGHTRYDDQIFAFQINSKRRRSLPNPGGDGFVVVENWSAAPQVHRLPILVDHVVVHSGNRKGREKKMNSGFFENSLSLLNENLSNMESSQRPRTVTRLTLAGTWGRGRGGMFGRYEHRTML